MSLSVTIDNLFAARDSVAAKLAAVAADPKPTYSVGERSFSWAEYYRMLLDMEKGINEQIARLQPYCQVSQVI